MGACNCGSKQNDIYTDIDGGHGAAYSTTFLYVIGKNDRNQLGVKNKSFTSLTAAPALRHNLRVKEIFCTLDTMLIVDHQHRYWIVGSNEFGQCGINDTRIQYLYQPHEIRFFHERRLKIHKICANVSSQCIFWITDDYKVFAFGRNQYYQMGVGHKMDLIQPTQIEWFRGAVIDIQCADKYSVALCNVRTAVPFILKAWMESLVSVNCFLPAEIVQVTQAFCDSGVVYKTRYSPGLIEYASDNKYWTQLKGMNGKFERANIVQVRCGVCFSLFLDRRGRIWGYGSNEQQQLGIECVDCVPTHPLQCRYFTQRAIRIARIECGAAHSVALDDKGNAYAWGDNKWFQLGNIDDRDTVGGPSSMQRFIHESIVDIQCGAHHSVGITANGDYYFWGSNWHRECLRFGHSVQKCLPYACTQINHADIVRVCLGNQCTVLTVKKKL